MANHKSTKKRIKTDKIRHTRNMHFKSMMRTSIRSVQKSENQEDVEKNFRFAVKTIDKVASKGIIHKNRASAYKSRLAKYVNNFGQA